MNRTKRIICWSGTLLLLLLAACNEDLAPSVDDGSVQVRISSSMSANGASTSISAQGVPVDPETGESGVARAVLEVSSLPTGEQLFFKDGQVVSEAEGEAVSFTPEEGGVSLALPPGTYSFFLTAFDDREPANELAFGLVENAEVGDADAQISIDLVSFLGEVTFRVPESVQPNAVFDAFLDVSPPGRPDLRVPEGDYTVTYEALPPSQILSESQLGARVAAACDDVEIVAQYKRRGPRAGGGTNELRTTVPVRGDGCGGAGADVGADLVPPFIAITSPNEGADVNADFTLSGDVNDQQSGVEKVEVYEGTVLLGEADIDANEMRWSFGVSLEKGDYLLTAVAFDKAGNTRRAEVNATVKGGGSENEACTTPIEIPDENLRNRLRGALDLPDDAELTCEALAELITFELQNVDGIGKSDNVTRLEGLQYAVNLERLTLGSQTFRAAFPFEDLDVVSQLENLSYLAVDQSGLETLSFLEGLTNLEELDLTPLQSGRIEDISALETLVNLERLYLSRNMRIRDISPLADLTELEILFLDGNAVRDITPLEDLTSLDALILDFNEIGDLSPLLDNEGLGEGDDEISLNVNCFDASEPDVLEIIQQLEARNPDQTNVTYDEMFEPNSEIDCSYLE